MNDVDLAVAKTVIASRTDGSTHYEGCWCVHGWCLAAELLAEAERLRGRLARQTEVILEMQGEA